MSQYLLNIASRSAETKDNGLTPSLSGFNIGQSGKEEDFAKGESDQDSGNQFLQPDISTFETPIFKNAPNDQDFTKIKGQQKGFEPSYFSKYIDRVNKPEDPEQKPIAKTVSDKFSRFDSLDSNVPISKVLPEIKEKDWQVGERNSEKWIDADQKNKTKPEKKNYINPILEKTAIGKDKPISDNLPKANISPRQPFTDNSKLILNKGANQTSPKLVIGKITVEILPPVKTNTVKVIQQVVQPPARENFSKTNKLIFGLGQL